MTTPRRRLPTGPVQNYRATMEFRIDANTNDGRRRRREQQLRIGRRQPFPVLQGWTIAMPRQLRQSSMMGATARKPHHG